LKITLIFDMF